MRIKILYFASMRDASGHSEEWLETQAQNIHELFDELHAKYSFPLAKKNVRAALNEEYVPFEKQLSANDTIVFIPPVAGG